MKTITHVCFGLACGAAVASFYAERPELSWGWNGLTMGATALVALGATVPDLDSRQSPIARAVPFLAIPISQRWPHRTLMHSLAGLTICVTILYSVLAAGYGIADYAGMLVRNQSTLLSVLFAFAYLSHLILDTLTRQGVRWLYPLFQAPFGYPSLEQYRVITGDRRAEWLITLFSLGLFCAFVPVMLEGADVSLRNIIGKFNQLRDGYLQAVSTEVVLEFEGHLVRDKAPVAGRALILDATLDYFVVFWNGAVHFIGEAGGDIYLRSGRCEYWNRPPEVKEVEYRGSSIDEILRDVETRVLMSGELTANQAFEVKRPDNAKAVTVSPTALRFNFARRADIEALSIQPKAESVSKLRQELVRQQEAVGSLLVVRSRERDLYRRDVLYTKIEELRQESKRLEDKLKTGEEKLLFAGRIKLRTPPSFEETGKK